MKTILYLSLISIGLLFSSFITTDWISPVTDPINSTTIEEEKLVSYRINEDSPFDAQQISMLMDSGEDVFKYITIESESVSNACQGRRIYCVNNSRLCLPTLPTLFCYENLCDPSVFLFGCTNKKPKCNFNDE